MIMTFIWVPLDVMDLPIKQLLLEVISCASKLYGVTGMYLFCLMAWMTWMLFDDVIVCLADKHATDLEIVLNSFKKRYDKICQLIDEINDYLGVFIFIFIAYTMASFSMICFTTVVELRQSDGRTSFYLRNGFLIAQHALNLTMISYIPYFIQNQVIISH